MSNLPLSSCLPAAGRLLDVTRAPSARASPSRSSPSDGLDRRGVLRCAWHAGQRGRDAQVERQHIVAQRRAAAQQHALPLQVQARALGMHQAKENVFTNIDSAVIA